MVLEQPLVSIIIPTYNCGDYIEAAIKSALQQTYSNKEIIVVDDGSTDHTRNILSKYKNKIIVISKSNQGLAKARNEGIAVAKGKYIATLDADDRWLPRRLEKMIPLLEENQMDIVISNFYYVDEQGTRMSHDNAFADDYIPPVKKQFEHLLWRATIFGLMIIKKEYIEKIGGYDESLKGEAEDYDLWLRLLKEGLVWGYYPEALAEIMFRSGSLSREYSPNRKEALKKIFNKHTHKIGRMKAYILYRYHLGGYRWDLVITSIKARNIRMLAAHSLIMLRSPFFMPVIVIRVCGVVYRRKLKAFIGKKC